MIHGDHRRAIIGLSFSRTGEYVATMGNDNNRSIAIYRWGKDKKLGDMRIGLDKGHNDDVYALAYNPVTDLPCIPPVASPHLTSLGATWQVRTRVQSRDGSRRRCWEKVHPLLRH